MIRRIAALSLFAALSGGVIPVSAEPVKQLLQSLPPSLGSNAELMFSANPLGQLALDHEDFYWITTLAMDVARRHAGGKLVSVLEGGYHLKTLPLSVEAHLTALLGHPYSA